MPWRTDGGMTYWVDDNGPDGWQPTQPASATHDPTGTQQNGTTGFANKVEPPGGGAGAPAATTTGSAGDFASDSLKLDAGGHLWGEKRVISADPNSPGNTRYQFTMVDLGDSTTPAGLAAISAASGIPVGALTAALPGLQATRAQQQRGTNGSVIGANADGTITYYDRGGNIQSTADMGVLGAAGIQQADILQARTDYAQRARTQVQSGQYKAVSADPASGTVTVTDFNDTPHVVPIAQAKGMPGVDPNQVDQLLQEGVTRNFNSQTVGQTLGFALPGGAQPTPAASAVAPPAQPTPPAPAAAPNYLPTPPAAAPAATPTPAPSPSPTSSYPTPPAAMATTPPTGGAHTPTPAPTPATGAQTSGTSAPTGGGTFGAASGPNLQAQYQAAAAAYTAGSDPNSWTNQQLSLTNQAKQNYLNYGKAAQSQQTAALAGQSRDASGTGFSSIDQRQTLAGQ